MPWYVEKMFDIDIPNIKRIRANVDDEDESLVLINGDTGEIRHFDTLHFNEEIFEDCSLDELIDDLWQQAQREADDLNREERSRTNDFDLPENLSVVTTKFLEAISLAESISDLGSLLMEFEVVLGQGETNEFQNDDPDMEYIGHLDKVWSILCDAAVEQANRLGFDPAQTTLSQVEHDLYDNYIAAALTAVAAARVTENARDFPLLAWAAFNKHSYKGLEDEMAVIRMLLWAGYNPDAQDEHGQTALHYMASTKVYPYSHPRAVRLLLQSSKNLNIRNGRGDTAMCYMAGNRLWTDELTLSFMFLLNGGADPLAKSNDGMDALLLLKEEADSDERKSMLVRVIER